MKLYKDFETKDIKLVNKTKENKILIYKNDEPLEFQTDPCVIVAKKTYGEIENNKNLILALDIGIEFEKWISFIQEKLESKFNNFSPFLSKDLLVKTDDKTMGFTKQKEFLPLSKLEIGDSVICILKTTGTWSDSISTNLVWKVKQIIKIN